MIIRYNYEYGNISPGIYIKDESSISKEEEVILFPFTFYKISKIEERKGTINDKHIIYLDIINKNKIFEFELKKGKKLNIKAINNKIII